MSISQQEFLVHKQMQKWTNRGSYTRDSFFLLVPLHPFLQFFLESKVKPRNKQELVDGIKKFWERRITPEKCAKYIDHVLYKAIPAVVEAEGAATKY